MPASPSVLNLDFRLLPKQLAFVSNEAAEALFSGSFGCGKSFALCVKSMSRVCRRGAREGLFRLKYKDVKATTLQTLLRGDGDMPAVLKQGMYEYNKSEGVITVCTGGQILLGGLDADRDKGSSRIGSLNLSGCGVDQAEELLEQHWLMLSGRLRVKVPNLPMQLYAACNPGAPSHFLAQRFGIAPGVKPFHGCWVVQTETADNQFLPPEYLERVAGYTGIMFKRYVKGLWVANEGAVYDMWEREKHAVEVKGVFKRIYIGIDDGFQNPFALLVMGVKANGSKHILAEVYEKNLPEATKVLFVKEMAAKYGTPEYVVVDPAAASIKGALRTAGFVVVNGQNDVLEGIAEVQNQLMIAGHGAPGLTVEPTCTQTISNIEAYHWDPKAEKAKDRPVKVDDHAADALRYLCMALRKPVTNLFQAEDLNNTKIRSATVQPEFEGLIDHRLDPGAAQDLSLARGEQRHVFLRGGADWTTIKIWDALVDGKAREDRRYIIFAGFGCGASPPAAIVVDCVTRHIVAQWSDQSAGVEQTARALGMLGLFFGSLGKSGRFSRAMLGYYAHGAGNALTYELRKIKYDAIWYDKDRDEPGWDPTKQEFADAVMNLRVALKQERLYCYQPEMVNQAKSYIWHANGSVGPLHLADTPEAKGTYLDWVILAAGALLMLKASAMNPVNEHVFAPGSMQAKLQAEERARRGRV